MGFPLVMAASSSCFTRSLGFFAFSSPSNHSFLPRLCFHCSSLRMEEQMSGLTIASSASASASSSSSSSSSLSSLFSSSSSSSVMDIADYRIEGISIGGHETCIIVPKLKVAFDIGRCPQRAISQDFLFISHGHLDHIGGIAMYVATRGLYKMKPPVVIVPKCIKKTVEKLFEVYRELDGSELKHELIALDIGETYAMGKGLVAKAFKTYHVIPSQGYLLYSVRNKLKAEYLGLSGNEIKNLKETGVEITFTTMVPEIAFTGDTMADFIVDKNNEDVMKAKVLVMEATFVNDSMSVEQAREHGHTHLSEALGEMKKKVVALADRFHNEGIVFIHFSARHRTEEIQTALKNLPKGLHERSFALLDGL